MNKPRLYKCYGEECCKKNIKHEFQYLIEEGGKRYCKSCLENKHREQEERRELYNTIKELFNVSFPTGKMLKQIKRYEEEAGYTLTGMTKTLKYLKNNCNGIVFNSQIGLGIISYKYEEAKEYWIKQQRIADGLKKMKENNLNDVIVVNTIKPNTTNKYKNERMIDLDSLL